MSNPFEKLHVKRDEDDDDDQGEFQKVKGKEKNVPIGLEQKKKKNRPVEKVQDDDDEGFEEVNKMRKKKPVNDEEEDEAKGGEHKKRKGINYHTVEDKEYRTKDKPKRGRQYHVLFHVSVYCNNRRHIPKFLLIVLLAFLF